MSEYRSSRGHALDNSNMRMAASIACLYTLSSRNSLIIMTVAIAIYSALDTVSFPGAVSLAP